MKVKPLPNFVQARLQNVHVKEKCSGKHLLVSCVDIFLNNIGDIGGIFETIDGLKYSNSDLMFLNEDSFYK